MMRTLAAELRAELAARRAPRVSGPAPRRGWRIAVCAAAVCLVAVAVL